MRRDTAFYRTPPSPFQPRLVGSMENLICKLRNRLYIRSMDVLTNKIAAQIFGLYLGSKATNGEVTGELVAIDTRFMIVSFTGGRVDYCDQMSNCKLLLRDISQITDAERTEIAVLVNEEIPEDVTITDDMRDRFAKSLSSALKDGECPLSVIQYLLSIGIAIPYKGIDLFKNGIAELEKKKSGCTCDNTGMFSNCIHFNSFTGCSKTAK